MLNRDIYDILLTELNMRYLYKFSKICQLYYKMVEAHSQKIFLTKILSKKNYNFTKYLLKNYTCYYCQTLQPSENMIYEYDFSIDKCYNTCRNRGNNDCNNEIY